MRWLLLLLFVLPTPAQAEPSPFKWPTHTNVPRRISDGLVAGQITLAAIDAWRAPDRGHALKCLAARNAIGFGVTEVLKRVVHRGRPDASDRLSFPSGHTMAATVNGREGWRYGLSVGVGWGRMAAGRHYATDVLAGAGIGWLAHQVCSGE